MPCDIKQNADASTGMQGTGGGDGEFVALHRGYNATSVNGTIFTASRNYVVKSVVLRPDVIGSDASAVTVAVKIAASGTAIASGVAVHSGTGDLKGTANTNQTLTLSTNGPDLLLLAGQSIGLAFTGVLTAAVGNVSITLCPA